MLMDNGQTTITTQSSKELLRDIEIYIPKPVTP